MYFLQKITFLF